MTDTKPLRNGVHIGLAESEYFEQAALGSSDMVKLWTSGLGWWHQSKNNPYAKERDREFLDRGHALHCLMLEGAEAYANRFAVMPDKSWFPGVLVTKEDMETALKDFGAQRPSAGRKSDFAHYCRTYLRDRPIWDDIIEKWTADNEGLIPISAETHRYVTQLTDAAHEEETIAPLIDPASEHLTELSVFWDHGGTRLRFRFDALFPQFAVDLKSIEVVGNDSLERAASRRIRDLHLDIQMALSFEARAAMYQHIEAGRIYGGTRQQRAWLKRFPTQARHQDRAWSWLWLFAQWPNESAGRAPEILPVWIEYGDQLHIDGVRKYLAALDTYTAAVKRFGLDTPWRSARPVHGLRGTGPQLHLPPDYGPPVMPHRDEEAILHVPE